MKYNLMITKCRSCIVEVEADNEHFAIMLANGGSGEEITSGEEWIDKEHTSIIE